MESERGEAVVAFERARREYDLAAARRRIALAHVADKDLRESMVLVDLEADFQKLGKLGDRVNLLTRALEDRHIAAEELTAQAHATAASRGRLGPSEGFKAELDAPEKPPPHEREDE